MLSLLQRANLLHNQLLMQAPTKQQNTFQCDSLNLIQCNSLDLIRDDYMNLIQCNSLNLIQCNILSKHNDN